MPHHRLPRDSPAQGVGWKKIWQLATNGSHSLFTSCSYVSSGTKTLVILHKSWLVNKEFLEYSSMVSKNCLKGKNSFWSLLVCPCWIISRLEGGKKKHPSKTGPGSKLKLHRCPLQGQVMLLSHPWSDVDDFTTDASNPSTFTQQRYANTNRRVKVLWLSDATQSFFTTKTNILGAFCSQLCLLTGVAE